MNASMSRPALALSLIAATALACGLSSNTAVPTAGSSSPTEASQGVSLSDDFSNSSSGWETEQTADDTIDYANGGLRIKVWSTEYFAWSDFGNQDYKDIHMEVTAKDQSPDNDHSFGFLCGQQGKQVAHYFLALDPNGLYEIGKRAVGSDDVVLNGSGSWTQSNLIPKKAASYRLGADCGHGTLAFYVNGKLMESVKDSTYPSGIVALFVWSVNDSTGPVTFDDFSLTTLR